MVTTDGDGGSGEDDGDEKNNEQVVILKNSCTASFRQLKCKETKSAKVNSEDITKCRANQVAVLSVTWMIIIWLLSSSLRYKKLLASRNKKTEQTLFFKLWPVLSEQLTSWQLAALICTIDTVNGWNRYTISAIRYQTHILNKDKANKCRFNLKNTYTKSVKKFSLFL